MKKDNQVQVSPRITKGAAAELTEIYKSLTHGASEACRYWPLVRRFTVAAFQQKLRLTKKQRAQISEIELPPECSKAILQAIFDAAGIRMQSTLEDLSTVEIIVLIDLIRNDQIELVGHAVDLEGEEI